MTPHSGPSGSAGEETAQWRLWAPRWYHRDGHGRGEMAQQRPRASPLSQGRGESRQLSSGPRHPGGVTGTGTRGGHGREETAQWRPWAPQRCHWEGERGDSSAVSLGRGERRRLSGGSGYPGGVTGKGTRGGHGWGQRGRGRHRREAAGSVAPGTSAPCQLWWKGGPDGERVLPHRAAVCKQKAEDMELCGALQLEKE